MSSNQFICISLETAVDRPLDGCPTGTYGSENVECTNTCFCEDHCSWKTCKLKEPPKTCLAHANRNWEYDEQKIYWRTKIKGNY